MAIIKLKYGGAGGKYIGQLFDCLVDDEYVDYLSQFPWRLHNDHGRNDLKKAYALCDISEDKLHLLEHQTNLIELFRHKKAEGKKVNLRMHRLIYCQHNGLQERPVIFDVDHINSNGLDNRLINLRQASKAQNSYNKRGQREGSYGIYQTPKGYQAMIMHRGKRYCSRVYKTEWEAKVAYDELAKKYHGVYANLHFPNGIVKQLNLEDLTHG